MAIASERIAPVEPSSIGDAQEQATQLRQKINAARTLPELQEALQLLTAWVRQYPEQHDQMEPLAEQLAMRAEGAREAQAEARSMGLSAGETTRREQVLTLCRRVRAEDAPEVFASALSQAWEALQAWQALHPEDPTNGRLHEILKTETYTAQTLREMTAGTATQTPISSLPADLQAEFGALEQASDEDFVRFESARKAEADAAR